MEFKEGEDIMDLRYCLAVAASGNENLQINELGGGNDLIVLEMVVGADGELAVQSMVRLQALHQMDIT